MKNPFNRNPITEINRQVLEEKQLSAKTYKIKRKNKSDDFLAMVSTEPFNVLETPSDLNTVVPKKMLKKLDGLAVRFSATDSNMTLPINQTMLYFLIKTLNTHGYRIAKIKDKNNKKEIATEA